MFTGLVTAIGTVERAETQGDLRLRIACGWDDLALGESICCSGACLTVVETGSGWFDAELSAETVERTSPRWKQNERINLERSLRADDRLGGHFVTGHVDGLATLRDIKAVQDSHQVTLEAPGPLAKYIAEKGSVTLDGVSLTVNRVNGSQFDVMIIPHTWTHTTLGLRKPGDTLNLEVDLIARYLERLRSAA